MASASPEVGATDERQQSSTPVEAKFDAPISVAIQDVKTLEVFTAVPSKRIIQRFTAHQLTSADTKPAATGKLKGEPQRIIVRSIDESRYVFVQCVNPSILVQLEAVSLSTVREIPLPTSAVSDLFGSEASDDPYVWMIVDDKPPESRSPVRRWKLAVVNFNSELPAVAMLQPCIGAIATPDGKSLLVSASGRGAVRMAITASDKPVPALSVRPAEIQLETIQLRRGCFFSPAGDAIVAAGQQIILDGSAVKPINADTTMPSSQVPATSTGTIVSYLRSAPLTVVQAEVKLNDAVNESRIQIVDAQTGRIVSTLPPEMASPSGQTGENWWVFEVPAAKGLLFCTSTQIRFLSASVLPHELVESLNAPSMALRSNPDLTFHVGETKEIPLETSDARCTIAMVSGPQGMTFHDGAIQWQPRISQQGNHRIEIEIAAGSRKRNLALNAHAGFDVQKLPAVYSRSAYSESLRLLAGAASRPDGTKGVEILRENEKGRFDLVRWIPLANPAIDLAIAATGEKSGTLIVRSEPRNKLNLFDAVAGTQIGDVTPQMEWINSISVGTNSRRSLIAYSGPSKTAPSVLSTGLFELTTLKNLGGLFIEPDDNNLQPERIFVRPDSQPLNGQKISIVHASLSGDGRTLHLITHPLARSANSQYSEWSIPEETAGQSFELTCRYRIAFSYQSTQSEPATLISGTNGFAACHSTLFARGQLVPPDGKLTKPLFFVPNQPFLIRWQLPSPEEISRSGNTLRSLRYSVLSLNKLSAETPEFTIPTDTEIPIHGLEHALHSVSNAAGQTLLFVRGDTVTRVPYSAIGIHEQPFEPAALITGPRTLQAGSTYEFPIELFPRTATITIGKSPGGVSLENNRLKWIVGTDSSEQEAVSLIVTDNNVSKIQETQFNIEAAVPVKLGDSLSEYTFDADSGLLAAIDSATQNILMFDVKQLQAGNAVPLRTIKLNEPPAIVKLKRVEDKSWLIVVLRDSRRVQVIDPESAEIRFDLTGKTLNVVADVVVSPDPKVPFVVLNGEHRDGTRAIWQPCNVKTGDLGQMHANQHCIAFAPSGSGIAVHDPRTPEGAAFADLNDPAVSTVVPLKRELRRVQFSPVTRSDCVIDFPFRRSHQNGLVLTTGAGVLHAATQLKPSVFFRKIPFYLSLATDANPARNGGSDTSVTQGLTITAVSRNTLKPVGEAVNLKISASTLRTNFTQPLKLEVFLTGDEQTALVLTPQVCFSVPVARFRIADEVTLALARTEANYSIGSESAVEIHPIDNRATVTIDSLPEGMTFERNQLKWNPQSFDCGRRSLTARIKSGAQERIETISVRATLPGIRVPYSIVGMSAEPDRNQVFLYGAAADGANGEKQCPVTLADLTTRKIVAEATITADKLIMVIFEGDQIICVQENANTQELVVMKAADFSVMSRLPLSTPVSQLVLLRQENALIVAQNNRMVRISLPDLKATDIVEAANTMSQTSIPIGFNLRGATQGELSLNWDGSKRLWRAMESNSGRPQFQLQPALQEVETESSVAFLSATLRIARENTSPSFLLQTGASNMFRRSISLYSENRPNASRTMLRVSTVAAPIARIFPAAAAASSPETPDKAAPENQGAAVAEAYPITLTDLIPTDRPGIVAATNDLALAAVGTEIWAVRFDDFKLQLPKLVQHPEFIRQQSRFLLTGDGENELHHKIRNGNDRTRFALSARSMAITLDSKTGVLKVDPKAVADEFVQSISRGLQTIRTEQDQRSFDVRKITDLKTGHSISMIQQVLPPDDPVPDGMPIVLPIELVLLDDGQPVDALGYSVAVFVSAELLKTRIDDWFSKNVNSARPPVGPHGSDIEELRNIVDRLETRLKRAEALLRENGIQLPPD